MDDPEPTISSESRLTMTVSRRQTDSRVKRLFNRTIEQRTTRTIVRVPAFSDIFAGMATLTTIYHEPIVIGGLVVVYSTVRIDTSETVVGGLATISVTATADTKEQSIGWVVA